MQPKAVRKSTHSAKRRLPCRFGTWADVTKWEFRMDNFAPWHRSSGARTRLGGGLWASPRESESVPLARSPGAFKGIEVELLEPFETITPIHREIRPENARPINTLLLYHQAFLIEQGLGPSALLAVQPARLKIEPYPLVPFSALSRPAERGCCSLIRSALVR